MISEELYLLKPERIKGVYMGVDDNVGRIVVLLDDETTLIITGLMDRIKTSEVKIITKKDESDNN